MSAAKENLFVDQGSTYTKQFQLLGLNGPFDLTGFTASSQLRVAYTDVTASGAFNCSVANPPTSGTLQIELSASQSMALTEKCYLWDLELTSGSYVQRVLEGKVIVSPEVTK